MHSIFDFKSTQLGIMILLITCTGAIPQINFSTNGIIRHDTDLEKYVNLGKQDGFDCVGRYSMSEESNDYAVGILISPRWVLTAAHFVQNNSVWKFGDRFYNTKKIIKHPYIQPNTQEAQWEGRDIALVELIEPVWHIKPATRYYGHKELGKIITKIGFGYLGDGAEGLLSPRKQEKLGGQNVIDAIGGKFENRQFSTNVLVCDFDSPNSSAFNKFGSPTPLGLEIGGSKGDSGGGIFMEENGQLFLVGVVSGALNRNIKYGSVMALARVSTANDWIDSVIYK